jgi:hypothetical protein
MLLSCRLLDNVSSVNNWNYAEKVEFTEGDTVRLYIQLIDKSLDKPLGQWKPAGRRYVPAAGATLQVTLHNIDDDKVITDRVATQPYSGDLSIWYVDIVSTDAVKGTVSISLKLTETAKVTRGRLDNCISVYSQENI